MKKLEKVLKEETIGIETVGQLAAELAHLNRDIQIRVNVAGSGLRSIKGVGPHSHAPRPVITIDTY